MFASGSTDDSVVQFVRDNRDFLFIRGNSKKTVFYIDNNVAGEEALYRTYKGERKEVIHVEKAKEIIAKMHRPTEEGVCNPHSLLFQPPHS